MDSLSCSCCILHRSWGCNAFAAPFKTLRYNRRVGSDLKSPRSHDQKHDGIGYGVRSSRMDHPLNVRLQRPPGGDLGTIASLNDRFVVCHCKWFKARREKRIYEFLPFADVIADLQVRGGYTNRIPITGRDEPFVNETAVNSEAGEVPVLRGGGNPEETGQPLF